MIKTYTITKLTTSNKETFFFIIFKHINQNFKITVTLSSSWGFRVMAIVCSSSWVVCALQVHPPFNIPFPHIKN